MVRSRLPGIAAARHILSLAIPKLLHSSVIVCSSRSSASFLHTARFPWRVLLCISRSPRLAVSGMLPVYFVSHPPGLYHPLGYTPPLPLGSLRFKDLAGKSLQVFEFK